MLLGYVRVSDDEQETRAQHQAMLDAGVGQDAIYVERTGRSARERPELQRMLARLREGDTVVVWKLDKLVRSLRDMLSIVEQLDSKGAGFKSLTEPVDTTSDAGRMLATMLGVVAGLERNTLRERVRAGLAAARRDGRIGGRRPKLTDAQEREVAAKVGDGTWTAAHAARLFGLHRSSITRLVERRARAPVPAPVAAPSALRQPPPERPPVPRPVVARPATVPMPLSETDRAVRVETAALALIAEGKGVGADRAYIADVVARTGVGKEELLSLHRAGRLHLVDAEGHENLPRDKLAASTIEYRQTRFVFVQPHPALF